MVANPVSNDNEKIIAPNNSEQVSTIQSHGHEFVDYFAIRQEPTISNVITRDRGNATLASDLVSAVLRVDNPNCFSQRLATAATDVATTVASLGLAAPFTEAVLADNVNSLSMKLSASEPVFTSVAMQLLGQILAEQAGKETMKPGEIRPQEKTKKLIEIVDKALPTKVKDSRLGKEVPAKAYVKRATDIMLSRIALSSMGFLCGMYGDEKNPDFVEKQLSIVEKTLTELENLVGNNSEYLISTLQNVMRGIVHIHNSPQLTGVDSFDMANLSPYFVSLISWIARRGGKGINSGVENTSSRKTFTCERLVTEAVKHMAALRSKGKKPAILHWIVATKHGIYPYYDNTTRKMMLRKGGDSYNWDGKYVIDKSYTAKKNVVGYLLGDPYTVAMVENALRVQLTEDAVKDVFGRTCLGKELSKVENKDFRNIPSSLSIRAYEAMQLLAFGKKDKAEELLKKLDNETRRQILESIESANTSYRSAQETNTKELLVRNPKGEINLISTMEKILSHALFYNPEWVIDIITAIGGAPAIKIQHESHKNAWILKALGIDNMYTAKYKLKDPMYIKMLSEALSRIKTGASGTAEYDIQGIVPLHNSLEKMGVVLIGPLAMRIQGNLLDHLIQDFQGQDFEKAKKTVTEIRKELGVVITKFTNMIKTLSVEMDNIASISNFSSDDNARAYYDSLGQELTLAMSAVVNFLKASPVTEESGRNDLRDALYDSVIGGLIKSGIADRAGVQYGLKEGTHLVMQQILQELPHGDVLRLAEILPPIVAHAPSLVDAERKNLQYSSPFATFGRELMPDTDVTLRPRRSGKTLLEVVEVFLKSSVGLEGVLWSHDLGSFPMNPILHLLSRQDATGAVISYQNSFLGTAFSQDSPESDRLKRIIGLKSNTQIFGWGAFVAQLEELIGFWKSHASDEFAIPQELSVPLETRFNSVFKSIVDSPQKWGVSSEVTQALSLFQAEMIHYGALRASSETLQACIAKESEQFEVLQGELLGKKASDMSMTVEKFRELMQKLNIADSESALKFAESVYRSLFGIEGNSQKSSMSISEILSAAQATNLLNRVLQILGDMDEYNAIKPLGIKAQKIGNMNDTLTRILDDIKKKREEIVGKTEKTKEKINRIVTLLKLLKSSLISLPSLGMELSFDMRSALLNLEEALREIDSASMLSRIDSGQTVEESTPEVLKKCVNYFNQN